MRFSIFSSSIFLHSQNYMRVTIPTIKIRIEIFEFKEFHVSKWLNPQFNMFVLRKWTVQIGQKCVDSLSKRLSYFSIIEIQVKIGLFYEIFEARTLCRSRMRQKEVRRSIATITKMALPLMFSKIFGANMNYRT